MLSAAAAGFDVCFLLVILAGVSLLVVKRSSLADDLLLETATSPSGSTETQAVVPQGDVDVADERLVRTLQRVMVDERAYRLENLTVATLAQRLAVPEYRLRRVINQRLGHRNFNAYVNGLRLDHVLAVLADPAREGDSIMGIALDVGFQSIGPFNRAFKARCGVTPTEFRRQRLADCSNRPVEVCDLAISARQLHTSPGS
jgi:AraC-like DNA-binding protein